MKDFVFNLQMFAITEVATLDELKNTVATGGEIKLTADIADFSEQIKISKTMTLDLNGHKINGSLGNYANDGAKGSFFLLISDSELTITDNSVSKTGEICNNTGISILCYDTSILTIDNGIIKGGVAVITTGETKTYIKGGNVVGLWQVLAMQYLMRDF